MALFAKIGLNNVVENVVYVNNLDTMTEAGALDETIGQAKLQGETGHSSWLLCNDVSGNASRKIYPLQVGYIVLRMMVFMNLDQLIETVLLARLGHLIHQLVFGNHP